MSFQDNVTVVIPTSPIPAHPSTEIIEKTFISIRRHLPNARIVISCDGVRPELEHRREQYEAYWKNLLKFFSYDQKFEIIKFDTHKQQSGMLKSLFNSPAMPLTRPFILFCEHDVVIDDKPIDWEAIQTLLMQGEANTVRLYWHETIHPEHTFLFGERIGEFVKTQQFSGWPFIMRTEYMKHLLDTYFAENDCQMIESGAYGPILALPWEEHRTWAYIPQQDGVRFHHLDARRDPVTGVKDWGDW